MGKAACARARVAGLRPGLWARLPRTPAPGTRPQAALGPGRTDGRGTQGRRDSGTELGLISRSWACAWGFSGGSGLGRRGPCARPGLRARWCPLGAPERLPGTREGLSRLGERTIPEGQWPAQGPAPARWPARPAPRRPVFGGLV